MMESIFFTAGLGQAIVHKDGKNGVIALFCKLGMATKKKLHV